VSFSVRAFLPLAVAAALSYFLFKVHEILLPFVLAAALAYLMSPVVRFFEVRGLRRGPVVIFLYASVMTLLAVFSYKLAAIAATEAQEAAHNMPMYVEKGGQALTRLRSDARMDGRFSVLLDDIADHGKEWPQDILSRMPSFALGVLPVLEVAFLVPFIGFFIIREGPRWRDQIVAFVPSRYVEMMLNLFFELDNSLGRYVRGILLEALCVGCLAFVGFWGIGLSYALQIAVVVGLANVVPYVGPVIGVFLGGSVALFQWGTFGGLVKVILVCVGVRLFEDWFIQPTVLQKAVHLHPVLVVFALMSGAELFGFWGLMFAVPVACMAKVLLEIFWPWYRSQYGFVSAPPLPEVNRIPLV
jgi:predicted PurR-regulated permease PerM